MKTKRRIRKKPLSLTAAEIAEIDGLADRHWQNVREQQALEEPILAQPPGDPGWRFILARVRDVSTDAFDRVLDEAVGDLLVSDIPLSQDMRQYIKGDRDVRADPKRRKRNKDDALAFAIANHLRFVTALLRDAGFKDAKTRAAEHAAAHWRKIELQDRGRGRFSSGEALTAWLRRRRDPTKTPPKMSCHLGRSERSFER